MNAEHRVSSSTSARTKRPGIAQRRRIVSRLWQTAEKQVDEVESRLSALREDPQALERDAKTLAVIARTIRDLVAIDEEARAVSPTEKRNHAPVSTPARALAEFRRELAERLEQLRLEHERPEAP